MDRDIIMDALKRFQEIVASDRPLRTMLESDRRLARLAIKKYRKTMDWRANLPRYHSEHPEILT